MDLKLATMKTIYGQDIGLSIHHEPVSTKSLICMECSYILGSGYPFDLLLSTSNPL